MATSSISARKSVADRIKMQLLMNNYGLPENAEIIGLGDLSLEEAKERIPAIFELWVRLDVWTAKGEDMKGSIDYPEARRRIDYTLISKRPGNSTVLLKALVPKRRKRR
jgi:predicted Zn-dependent peptidase